MYGPGLLYSAYAWCLELSTAEGRAVRKAASAVELDNTFRTDIVQIEIIDWYWVLRLTRIPSVTEALFELVIPSFYP